MSALREPRRLQEGGADVDAQLAAALRRVSHDGPTHAQLEAIAEQVSLRSLPNSQAGILPEADLATRGAAKLLGAKWLGLAALGGALWLGAQAAWPSPAPQPPAPREIIVSREAQARSTSSPSSGPVSAVAGRPGVASKLGAAEGLRPTTSSLEPLSRPSVATGNRAAARATSASSAEGEASVPGARHAPGALAGASGQSVAASPGRALAEPSPKRGAPTRPAVAGPHRTPAPAVPSEPPIVAELDEVALIASAQQLVQTQPQQALYQLSLHARRFAHGAFAEERDALRVFALARLGELLSAQREARAFLQRYPSSIHRQQIAAVLSAAK